MFASKKPKLLNLNASLTRRGITFDQFKQMRERNSRKKLSDIVGEHCLRAVQGRRLGSEIRQKFMDMNAYQNHPLANQRNKRYE